MNERGFESIIEKTFYTSVRQVTDIFLSERVTKHVLQEEHKGQGEVEKKDTSIAKFKKIIQLGSFLLLEESLCLD